MQITAKTFVSFYSFCALIAFYFQAFKTVSCYSAKRIYNVNSIVRFFAPIIIYKSCQLVYQGWSVVVEKTKQSYLFAGFYELIL